MNDDLYARRRVGRSDDAIENEAVWSPGDGQAVAQEAAIQPLRWNSGTPKLPSVQAFYADDDDRNGYDSGPELRDDPSGDQPDNEGPGDEKSSEPKGPKGDNWLQKLLALIKRHPRRSLAIGFAFILIVTGVTAAILANLQSDPPKQEVAKTKKKAVEPEPITSPLTGNVVTAEQAKHIVTGAMIENTVFARPQSGLKDAGVVFEAIAEAGITRFLALYQEAEPANMGPIRSARPYYVDWAHSFDAPLAHVGGSPDALAKIKAEGTKDLDQFNNSGAYHRINTREAPHNMYTNIPALMEVEKAKGWTTSEFTGFARKKESPTKQPPTAANIDFAISGPTYNAHYAYDAASNSYLRSEGGAPHMDADSNTQLAPKVVIGLVVPYALMSDGYHSEYQIGGTGEMTVFQDGTATKGTWTRKDAASQYEFKDESGKPLKLNPGQTWITVVSTPGAITSAP